MADRLLIALCRVLSWLPLSFLHRLGGWLGALYWRLSARDKRVALRNLSLCFPDMSEADRLGLCRESFREAGKTLAELPMLLMSDTDKVLDKIVAMEGAELLQQAQDSGKGIIFLTPHLAAWELGGLYVASLGEVAILYRPSGRQHLDAYIRQSRGRAGATMVATDSKGVRTLLRRLRSGGNVGILPDQQPPRGNGLFADFFSVKAYSMTLVGSLARRTGAVVLIGYVQRLSGSSGYKIIFRQVSDDIYSADELCSVTALNRAVEDCVRDCPEQYQWSYARFRKRPDGEQPVY